MKVHYEVVGKKLYTYKTTSCTFKQLFSVKIFQYMCGLSKNINLMANIKLQQVFMNLSTA